MLIWAWKALIAALLPSAAGAVLGGVSDFGPLLAVLASVAAFRASAVSLARVVTRLWAAAAEPLLAMETASVTASLSESESVVAELAVVVIACGGMGCCTPTIAAASDCEMKAREDGEVASESLSLEAFTLPLVGPATASGSAGAAIVGAVVDTAAAAFCAAWACDCDCASRSINVAGGVLSCWFAASI